MSLDEIGIKFQTDKSTINHSYLPFYELFFPEHLTNFLEIGVQFGNSIKVWRERYPDANVVGIDAIDNGLSSTEQLNEFLLGNAYSCQMVSQVREVSPGWAIIIDDGSHIITDQQFVIANYSHLLYAEGILIVEDVPGMIAIPELVEAVPEGFYHAVVDLRTAQHNTQDSILFLVWRK